MSKAINRLTELGTQRTLEKVNIPTTILLMYKLMTRIKHAALEFVASTN